MIQWPCILKLDGDSELLFIDSMLTLNQELEGLIWGSADCLIDSTGQSYTIKQRGDEYLFESIEAPLSLQSVTQLIQEHEFSKAELCLTKIQFLSVEAAIQSLQFEG
ncbi:DUF4144 family protein [Vibrio breoganii]|uniref:DUF4144 family protein n=1 Tax=Vibrio breoganii TaxID=553239 RepID=UPI00080E5F4D|nr:DUF4144 family protein [Vibrio breoganii]OCH74488.1 hypothetical protein A6D95_13865 [Vibrio breoganii]PMK75071.1 hypothetical protein BCT94_01600 [Vibrio breoganii]PML28208.1 hypothetical protein BCT82_02015 [Vibrio breoganii]